MTAGVVYKDANVTVTAFATTHAMESYGYRFDTPDRSIVISGDTSPTQPTIFQGYAAAHHTTTTPLTELATKAKPGLLVLYHASLSIRPAVDSQRSTAATLLTEMAKYPGRLVVARDLDVY
ncbi:MAG: hypothetical protein ABIT71_13345 [Vicinamibacteraceae bacterium]